MQSYIWNTDNWYNKLHKIMRYVNASPQQRESFIDTLDANRQ